MTSHKRRARVITSRFPAIHEKWPTNVLKCTHLLLFTKSNRKVFDVINSLHNKLATWYGKIHCMKRKPVLSWATARPIWIFFSHHVFFHIRLLTYYVTNIITFALYQCLHVYMATITTLFNQSYLAMLCANLCVVELELLVNEYAFHEYGTTSEKLSLKFRHGFNFVVFIYLPKWRN